mgnify:CR=1 FL=1
MASVLYYDVILKPVITEKSNEQPSEASKQELAEPKENEFLDYSFGE